MHPDADRRAMRQTYADAWRRCRSGAAASDLDRRIAAVIEWHPEYHAIVENPAGVEREFTPEGGQSNPFLHMGLHLAIRDQLAADRPTGVRELFAQIRDACADEHAAEHVLLERLGEALWQAQRSGRPPDETAYLAALREDARKLRGT